MMLATGRWTCVALLACMALVCQAQFSRPGTPLGSPVPPFNPAAPTSTSSNVPPDPEMERAMLKERRIQAYKRMHADARTLGQLAAQLDDELTPQADAAKKNDPRKTAQNALQHARKIDKLAGDIDRLMSQD